jgi:hypothetical protein
MTFHCLMHDDGKSFGRFTLNATFLRPKDLETSNFKKHIPDDFPMFKCKTMESPSDVSP